jgi:hypothetical protein
MCKAGLMEGKFQQAKAKKMCHMQTIKLKRNVSWQIIQENRLKV